MEGVNANYYDGRSAQQRAVTLRFAQGLLEVREDELIREVPLSNLRISAKLGSAPRLVHFVDGGHCEVTRHADFEALLQEAGIRPQSFISRMEDTWRHALTATLLAIALVVASYYWGLPWLAGIVAARVPNSAAQTLDRRILSALDDGMMRKSALSDARQQALRLGFDGLKKGGGWPRLQLEFRSGKAVGANAFALPGGTIVVTDQLVALAGNDEEVFAVLAHELGHVSERHPLRQLLQSSAVGLAMAWYLSDVSNLLAAAPTLLLEDSYSRDFERRADRYAADMLRANGIAPARLADMLEKLESSRPGANSGRSSRAAGYFSTHPDTDERIRLLRGEGSRL